MKNTWFILSLLLLLFVSNQHFSLEKDKALISVVGPDSFYYLNIAAYSPKLPPAELEIPFHHGQRAMGAYVLGAISKIIKISPTLLFKLTTILLILGIVFLFSEILETFNISIWHKKILLTLFVLNPYSFRFYIAVPYLFNDLAFVLSVLGIIYALLKEKVGLLALFLIIGSLSRQTVLPFAFFIAYWIFKFWPKKLKIYSVLLLIPFALYFLTSKFALQFTLPNYMSGALTGLVLWIKNHFELFIFLRFMASAIIPYVFAAIVGHFIKGKFNSKAYAFLFAAILLAAQPVLSGPALTGQNMTRLIAIGLAPFLFFIASIWNKPVENPRVVKGILFLIFLASQHHVFSILGAKSLMTAENFAIFHMLLALILMVLMIFQGKLKKAT